MKSENKYWEYMTLTIKIGIEALHKDLNKLGADRWEAYHIDYKNEGLLGTYTVFLKRKV